MYDYLIVGAGFAGSVLAERLASQAGKSVLIAERRNHVGGNAFDSYNDNGILVHKYGPHIFHTNSTRVFDYLSQFTDWLPYEHRVLTFVDRKLLPFPINLNTINHLYGMNWTSKQLASYFESVREHRKIINFEDYLVNKIGNSLFEKFYRNYSRKQWGRDPSELDFALAARIPIRLNRDDRYFTDHYQAMPLEGYTKLFQKMLSHKRIDILLNTDFREASIKYPYKVLIYTGRIDEFFDFRFGRLEYRSLHFRFETHDTQHFQPAAVVNYPNDHQYTRITEYKYITGQIHPKTTISYEYPSAEGEPFYPVSTKEMYELYKRYRFLARITPNVHFLGRLATYKYYNMDQVVAQALSTFEKFKSQIL